MSEKKKIDYILDAEACLSSSYNNMAGSSISNDLCKLMAQQAAASALIAIAQELRRSNNQYFDVENLDYGKQISRRDPK